MKWSWVLIAFATLAWIVSFVWFIESYTTDQSYYESLLAFLMGSASLIGYKFFPDSVKTEPVTTTATNGSVALANVNDSKIEIYNVAQSGPDSGPKLNQEMNLLKDIDFS